MKHEKKSNTYRFTAHAIAVFFERFLISHTSLLFRSVRELLFSFLLYKALFLFRSLHVLCAPFAE